MGGQGIRREAFFGVGEGGIVTVEKNKRDSLIEGVWLLICLRSVRNSVAIFVICWGTLALPKAETFQPFSRL